MSPTARELLDRVARVFACDSPVAEHISEYYGFMSLRMIYGRPPQVDKLIGEEASIRPGCCLDPPKLLVLWGPCCAVAHDYASVVVHIGYAEDSQPHYLILSAEIWENKAAFTLSVTTINVDGLTSSPIADTDDCDFIAKFLDCSRFDDFSDMGW